MSAFREASATPQAKKYLAHDARGWNISLHSYTEIHIGLWSMEKRSAKQFCHPIGRYRYAYEADHVLLERRNSCAERLAQSHALLGRGSERYRLCSPYDDAVWQPLCAWLCSPSAWAAAQNAAGFGTKPRAAAIPTRHARLNGAFDAYCDRIKLRTKSAGSALVARG